MGDVTIYLVPTRDVGHPLASRARIIASLQKQQVIDLSRSPFYPNCDESECYIVGKNNLSAFDIDESEVDAAFQSCEVYGHPSPISIQVDDSDGGDSSVTTRLFVGFHETGGYSQIKSTWLRLFSDELGIDFKVISVWST